MSIHPMKHNTKVKQINQLTSLCIIQASPEASMKRDHIKSQFHRREVAQQGLHSAQERIILIKIQEMDYRSCDHE